VSGFPNGTCLPHAALRHPLQDPFRKRSDLSSSKLTNSDRTVHAKAAGAFGDFEITHDISDLTSAAFLSGVGKKTPILLRLSTVAGELGAADSVRDARGWAMKCFTEEGNQDFVFLNMPAFFVRDPIKFPSVNRCHKRHPSTNLPDADMVCLAFFQT